MRALRGPWFPRLPHLTPRSPATGLNMFLAGLTPLGLTMVSATYQRMWRIVRSYKAQAFNYRNLYGSFFTATQLAEFQLLQVRLL